MLALSPHSFLKTSTWLGSLVLRQNVVADNTCPDDDPWVKLHVWGDSSDALLRTESKVVVYGIGVCLVAELLRTNVVEKSGRILQC